MGPFAVELKLANSVDTALVHRGLLAPNQVRQTEIRGVVDTGAVRLVIPEHVATELGVREVDEIQVRLELLGREATFRASVESNRDSALIGAIVLEELDLLVDCTTEKLRPRDPNHIISEIE